MAKKKDKKFHCLNWYSKGVCPSVGEPDLADVRRDKKGWLQKPRNLCKTRGLSPFSKDVDGQHNWDLCPFCIEHRKYLREEPRHLTGEVVNLTPFQVKEEDTARTIKAYKTTKSVKRFLERAEKPEEVYGVEINSGKLITL